MKRSLVAIMAHETLPLAPQACSEPQANRKDPDAHYDALILLSHGARVLHARIVVGFLWESMSTLSSFFLRASAFSPSALVQVAPATQLLPDVDSAGDGFGLFSSAM